MKRISVFLVLFVVLSAPSLPGTREKGRIITAGDFFPEISFPLNLPRTDRQYLGLSSGFLGFFRGESFSLKSVKADLIVVEYLNKYCYSCQLQASVMNQVFSIVEKDPQLRGKIKFIGIGAGNNRQEVDSFRAEQQIPFPILPDPKYEAYEAIGDPGATPFSLFLRQTEAGLLVARIKIGFAKDPQNILQNLNDSLKADVWVLLAQEKDFGGQKAKERKLALPYSPQELLAKARESMRGPKWTVGKVAKVTLPDQEEIYIGEILSGKVKSYVFSRLIHRAPTCDVCHSTHFFFTFNEKGMIVQFLPLKVTKGDNLPWDGQEIEQMRRRLVGRSILQPVDFDPRLDAVSSATLTSALIVDSINRAKGLFESLQKKGYVQ